MRTILLTNGTIIVVRQIAAIGPILHKETVFETEDDQSDPPTLNFCGFDIIFVGGTKLYPAIIYDADEVEAARDRNRIVTAIETGVNEL